MIRGPSTPKKSRAAWKPRPSVAPALTAAIEPFEQDALAPVEELGETGRVANHPIVVPVPAVFGSQDGKKLTHPERAVAPDPVGQVGKRSAEVSSERSAV